MIDTLMAVAPRAPHEFLRELAAILADNPAADVRLSIADSLRELAGLAVDRQAARDLRALADVVAAQVTVGDSFTCPTCGATSYHPHDIAHRYCGRCHVFHDGLLAAYGASSESGG